MFGRRRRATEATAILDQSMAELQAKTMAHMEAWGLGETEHWNADLEAGLITFSDEDRVTVAPMQVVGTYNEDEGTWLWGWDHPSVPHELAEAARLAKTFGERHGLAQYTTAMVRCSQDDAWMFTALACHLSGAAGAYRGPAEPTYVFMTFGEVETQRPT